MKKGASAAPGAAGNHRLSIAALTLLLLCAGQVAKSSEPDWRDYSALLQQYVTPGERFGIRFNQVDYAALARDPRFAAALATVEGFDTENLTDTSEELAFHINAYNLLTLRMVTAHLPVSSIKDIGNFLRPVWKRKAGTLNGKSVTLDELEHAILRKMAEPRIHMAIVCASVSCPDLRPEAYTAAQLDGQLDDQAARFLANSGKGLRLDGQTAHVSKIFDWFHADFAPGGGVAAFVARYRSLPESTEITADLDYDWRLNSVSAGP